MSRFRKFSQVFDSQRKVSRIRESRRYKRCRLFESLEPRRLLASVRLDDPQAIVGAVDSVKVSNDGQYAVYIVDAERAGVKELYSLDLNTNESVKLSGVMPSYGDVRTFDITADGQTVVFAADIEIDERLEIYSTPINTASPLKLNGPKQLPKSLSAKLQALALVGGRFPIA